MLAQSSGREGTSGTGGKSLLNCSALSTANQLVYSAAGDMTCMSTYKQVMTKENQDRHYKDITGDELKMAGNYCMLLS